MASLSVDQTYPKLQHRIPAELRDRFNEKCDRVGIAKTDAMRMLIRAFVRDDLDIIVVNHLERRDA